jgi:hypothetical protein
MKQAVFTRSGYRLEGDKIVHYGVMGDVIGTFSADDKGAQELLIVYPLGKTIIRFQDELNSHAALLQAVLTDATLQSLMLL